MAGDRIYMGSGSYNESIQGNYISSQTKLITQNN